MVLVSILDMSIGEWFISRKTSILIHLTFDISIGAALVRYGSHGMTNDEFQKYRKKKSDVY